MSRNGTPRLFRWALRLFPASFRRAYAEEMEALFDAKLERARAEGRPAVIRLWTKTLTDLTRTALAERRALRHRDDEEGTMQTWIRDVTDAARRLVRTPFFTLGAVALVAFGIGVNAAAFSVVDAFLFRPPPFDDPDRVVRIFQHSDDGEPSSSSYPAFLDMAAYEDVFESVAGVSPEGVSWERGDERLPLAAAFTSSSYLSVVGLSPAMGRWFEAAHDQVGSGLYAVLSHRLWVNRLASDPEVVGSTIRLNGQAVTVLGVGPEGFHGIYGPTATDLWLSISTTPVAGSFRVGNLERRQDHWYDVVARLADGVTVEQAQAAMDALASRLAADFPDLNSGRDITVFEAADVRVHPEVDGDLYPAAGLLLGVVGLVLLLACSNLANLLLVRGMARGPEVAVRRALGASGGRVAGLFLIEGLLLSAFGGAVGLVLARWLVALFTRLPVPLPGGGTFEIAVDARVAAFAFLLVVATGVLFGLAPALRSVRADVAGSLREDARSASPGRRTSAFRNGLVAVQVAVSVILLVGTGIVLRSLTTVGAVDSGVAAERLAYVGVSLPPGTSPGPETDVTFRTLEDRIAGLPGVVGVGRSTRLPVQDAGGTTTRFVEGYVAPSGTGNFEIVYTLVDDDYFEVVGIPVTAGSPFAERDDPDANGYVLVNETAARRYWDGPAAAVGGRIRGESADSEWSVVGGVVGDSKVRSLDEAETPLLYFPLDRSSVGRIFFLVRTEGDPGALVPGLRAAVGQVDPTLEVFAAGPLESHISTSLDPLRTASLAMGGFSLLAIVLATMGIYAVVSFVVARRTAELGIRIALGAARGRIVTMVVREILVTVGLGMVVGLGLSAWVLPEITQALFGVGRLDPVAYGGGAALFLLVAGLAAWLPARRAAGTDPVEALRTG